MTLDFSEFFKRYESLVADADKAFQAVAAQHPDCVRCQPGCSDCCYAMFDLSLVESLYLNHHFNARYQGAARSRVLERADAADREAYRLKRSIFMATQEGKKASEILAEVAKMRLRCPLLGDDDQCLLYDHRPVTCRLYGVPLAIEGRGRTCGRSGFDGGKAYPTVQVDKLQDKLMLLSQELVDSLNTRHMLMADVLVPVSMALLNTYDEEYLGILKEGEEPPLLRRVAVAEPPAAGCGGKGGHSWVLGDENGPSSAPLDCSQCEAKGTDGCRPEACGCDPNAET